MLKLKKPEYVVDSKGRKQKVILNYSSYKKMLELIEDLSDSKLIRKTKSESEISLEDYIEKRKLG